MQKSVRKLTLSALCLSLCYVLPFLTGSVPALGAALLPMHIPVFLCAFFCGWQWALGVGVIAPLLRALTIGAPVLFPTAVSMAVELGCYGLLTGVFDRIFPRKPVYLYATLSIAMLGGRGVWGLTRLLLTLPTDTTFPFSAFIAGAFVDSFPGVFLQFLMIPPAIALWRRWVDVKQD